MQEIRKWSAALVVVLIVLVLWWHGPIPQFSHYHEFADQTQLAGISHAYDVFSNLGFLLVGLWAGRALLASLCHPKARNAAYMPGLTMFVLSMLATAWCSSFYHLAPDDTRLFWDRLPIAVACASLLALFRAQCSNSLSKAWVELLALTTFALFSVMWWQATEDLRPYLLLQILAIVLPPLWQTINRRPNLERWYFAAAIMCYVVAKIAETADAKILLLTGLVSGHTLKHMLAALAAYFILRPLLAVLVPTEITNR